MTESTLTISRITRRRLLAGTALLGLSAALGGIAGTSITLAQGAPQTGPTDGARPGGTLTLLVTADPPSYDPLSQQSSFVLNVIAPCYNNLVRYAAFDPNTVAPDLAESWEVSSDQLTYTFNLRQGVQWHDGQPFTAADVKHTFDLVRSPPEGVASLRRDLLGAVVSIDVADDHTVSFTLSRPQPAFLQILAIGWMLVLPKHVIEAKGTMKDDMVGTGPYRFVSHQVGISIDLERNPNYFIPERPYLDGIRFYVIPDRNAAFNYTRTGELLLLDNITTSEANTALSDFPDRVNVQKTQSYTFASLMINGDVAPWNDIRVRKAVSLAIDRREALQVLRDGAGAIGGFMPPGPWQLPLDQLETIPGYYTDISASREEARQLLADAGFANGIETQIITRTGTTFEAAAIFVQDQLRQIGINATLAPQEAAIYQDNMLKRNFTLSPYSRTVYVNDPDAIFPDLYKCGGAQNFSGICSPEADAAFASQTSTDPTDRLKTSNEAEKSVMLEFGDLILFWRDRAILLNKSVRDYRLHPEPENNRRMEEVWLGA